MTRPHAGDAGAAHVIKVTADEARILLQEGFALQQQGALDQAAACYRRVLELAPSQFDALHLSGVIAAQRKNFTDAVALIGRAIAVDPNHAGAHYNMAHVLEDLRRTDAALASYDRVLVLKPDYATAHNNRGGVLFRLRRYTEAAASYERAIALEPAYADAHYNRAMALMELGRLADAVTAFDAALAIAPDYHFLPGLRLYAKMRICDWRHYDAETRALVDDVNKGRPVTPPWPLLAISDAPDVQQRAAALWTAAKFPADATLGALPLRKAKDKIRLAYVSMDFRQHPVSALIAEVIEKHDRARFEIFAFSFGPDTGDPLRKRMEKAFDHFIDVQQQADHDIAAQIRAQEIDIAIDLAGYTTDSRPGIFALRAAPIQVNYLGYPATMAAPYMDYIVADQTVIPASQRNAYTEKVAALPCFQANDSQRPVATKTFTRAELGLPATGFVFCCFNNTFKLNPDVFASWMRILTQVPDSVLLLFAENSQAAANLRAAADAANVAPARLVFAERIPMAEHLARYRIADLFLDTWPFNAGTTASDALWSGLPVLTRQGKSFVGRMAASLLGAVGLAELVTSSAADYEAMAVALARDTARLAGLKDHLEKNRDTVLLFDSTRTTRHLEAAYTNMITRLDAGLLPEHIDAVPAQ